MGFQQGLSGLNAASKALDTVGNNIANSATVGFKSGSAQFADVFAASLSGAGTSPVGIGAKVAAIAQQFSQGNISVTNNPFDTAINGGGFFGMDDGTGGTLYSRNGQFQLDKNGFIVNAQGLQLKGIVAGDDGVIATGSPAQALRLFDPAKSLSGTPQMTGGSQSGTGVQVNVNLDSRLALPTVTPFDPNNTNSYSRATATTIYDSLGNPHTYSMYFVKTATANEWNVYATLRNPEGAVPTVTDLSAMSAADTAAALPAVTAATLAEAAPMATAGSVALAVAAAGVPQSVIDAANRAAGLGDATAASVLAAVKAVAAGAIGTMTFTTSGVLPSPYTPFPVTLTDVDLGYPGAVVPSQEFNLDFAGSTQYGSQFAVNAMVQDGYAAGTLAGFNIGQDGLVQGRYTNGQTKAVGQVVLATFRNPQGLQPLGDNRWAQTPNSGDPIVGIPGSSGQFGVLQSSSIEDSNVDLTAELVNMITQQRAYQANAQTIKTVDSILQTLVNLR